MDSIDLNIFVDTSQILEILSFSRYERNDEIGENGYPILISNSNEQHAVIGFGWNIYFIMEAMDVDGNWKPIQRPHTYLCGVGIFNILLPKDNMAVSVIPVYKGTYKTKLRVRLGKSVSNEFEGTIDPNQFKDINLDE